MPIRTQDKGRDHIRELLVDDQVASWLIVIDYTIRIGAAQVRMAGIGGVNTHKEHRMKGYMRALCEDTVAYIIREGYDVSMLFGISNFYDKFGYTSCLPEYSMTIQTRNAEKAEADTSAYKMRLVEERDWDAVLALYNRRTATRTASIERSVEHFRGFNKGSTYWTSAKAVLWEDESGQLVAYAAWDKDEQAVNVIEVHSVQPETYPMLLKAFAQRAIEKRCGEITLFIPPDHPFAEFVQRYGCEWRIKYPTRANGMMRLLNQTQFFDKIGPELERRVAHSRLAGLTHSLQIETDVGTTTLNFHHGKLTGSTDAPAENAITLPQGKLMQLITGCRCVRDLIADPDVHTRGQVRPLLEAIFPQGHPYVWLADYF